MEVLFIKGIQKEKLMLYARNSCVCIISLSDWKGDKTLYDHMCALEHSCEALMHYCNFPASYLRDKFGFEFFPVMI
jgi:hypothetical protein